MAKLPLPPQLLDLPVPVLFDTPAVAEVLFFVFLALDGIPHGLQAVLVEDLRFGDPGFCLAPDLGDLLPQLVAEGLFAGPVDALLLHALQDRKSTRLNSSHANISYAVFCLKKKKPL